MHINCPLPFAESDSADGPATSACNILPHSVVCYLVCIHNSSFADTPIARERCRNWTAATHLSVWLCCVFAAGAAQQAAEPAATGGQMLHCGGELRLCPSRCRGPRASCSCLVPACPAADASVELAPLQLFGGAPPRNAVRSIVTQTLPHGRKHVLAGNVGGAQGHLTVSPQALRCSVEPATMLDQHSKTASAAPSTERGTTSRPGNHSIKSVFPRRELLPTTVGTPTYFRSCGQKVIGLLEDIYLLGITNREISWQTVTTSS